MTLSREALFGLRVFSWLHLRWTGRRAGTLGLVVATLLVTVTWFAALAPEGASERITHPEREGGSG